MGTVSPVHFFWGAMDLACTRFSGRRAPEHPGGAPTCGDWVMVECYDRDLRSAGSGPGGGEDGASSCACPEPDGYADRPVLPEAAYCSVQDRQFLLPYEAVADSDDPDRTLAQFLHSTCAAAADLGDWDRTNHEDDPARWPQHRYGRRD